MERKNLAIHGADAPEGIPRVAIALGPDGHPELLHAATGGGRFARVFRGYVGSGRLPKPVAIKLERDEIDPAHGAVKFISEYRAQVRVHENLTDADRTRVVRLFEIWKLPPHLQCDELPPTILCPASKQTLAPRCPTCAAELRDDKSCANATCSVQGDDEILKASLCSICPEGSCPAYWLNHRTCHILLLELLDLDLDEYLQWRWVRPEMSVPDRSAWIKFKDEHLAAAENRDRRLGHANDALMAAFDEWRFVLDLFLDTVSGVRELHARRIAHLDLKPANLCLALEGADARLKIIDLGQADHPALPWSVRYQSICDDFEAQREAGSVFWAPEQMPSRFMPVDVLAFQTGSTFRLIVQGPDADRCDVLPGDYFCFPPMGRVNPVLRVTGGAITSAGREILAVATLDRPVSPSQYAGWKPLAGGCFVKHAGSCADLFSLGLLLMHILARGRVNLTPLRDGIDGIAQSLRAKIAAAGPMPARAAVDCLDETTDAAIAEVVHPLLDVLPIRNQLREPIKELFGIALQASIRGIPAFSYAAHRGDDAPEPVERMVADLHAVRNRLTILSQTHELHAGRVARSRQNGIERLRAWLRRQPSLPASSAPPIYDRERISNALDLLSLDDIRNEREFRYLLRAYSGVAKWLQRDVDLFRRELKARLTVARMHPVVVEMFRIVSPSMMNSKRHAPATAADLEAAQACDRLNHRRPIAIILDALQPVVVVLQRDRRIVLAHDDLTRLDGDMHELTVLANGLRKDLATVRHWHKAFQVNQRSTIAGWERLDLGGAGGWLAFGKSVLKHLAAKDEAVEDWARRVRAAASALDALAEAIRRDLVARWPEAFDRRSSGLFGLYRRIAALWTGRALRVPIPYISEQIANTFRQAASALSKIGAAPFDGRLPIKRSEASTPAELENALASSPAKDAP